MTVWRPPQAITVKVLGLVWRGDQLLLSEVKDDGGQVLGFRALGGCVEFGETREDALKREFQEELGSEINIISPWHGLENLFAHEGSLGHEYVFVATARLKDERFYAMDSVPYFEGGRAEHRASWHSPFALRDGVDLYPSGLMLLIERESLGLR
jgi:8-oxo-dGTP pyrophosphatase MutT (NUDIX family)